MLSLLTDTKNFAVGAISGSANRAGNWGRWAFGYKGESFGRVGEGGNDWHFSHFRIGGGLALSMIAATLAGGWFMFPVFYVGGMLGATALGAATGFVAGGVSELSAGRERRQAAELQQAQARDSQKIDQLTQQQEKLKSSMGKTRDKIEKLQERKETVHNRMQAREEKATPKGGWAEREMQRRAAVQHQAKGK